MDPASLIASAAGGGGLSSSQQDETALTAAMNQNFGGITVNEKPGMSQLVLYGVVALAVAWVVVKR